ncbi:polysaccharide biosynthesis C-terminal domain-containing protein [Myroides odoratimimus]|uniref:lipopolysaccharide biosynthesis protein n=1 Tax=Myroides odoratimimus TaxID=76832 RepID=UPI0025755951|nr:polysaccharide biosynthesis C-terminal domain-containing protein [Myroides odoratimimus]MDM1517188.1 polysaccharide biosynthesis C-terminal domain-containing protein [Myroides odoratimimus]MDM1536321.1 polysaccharide biosynthesis C-terminal domain-containing protein [Myroides odoratimimus]MDM1675893.1 polysaccharide biosynthesis C-terminal domain-containing protein [Myroides odoratimimus]
MNKEFIKNIIINNLSLGLQFGSRWLLSIVLLSTLGIIPFGIFSFIYSLANILVSVLPFGSQFYLIKETNIDKDNSKELQASVLILTILSFLVFGVILILDFLGVNSYGYVIYLGWILGVVFSINNILFSYLKGIGQFGFELKINVVFSLLIFALMGYVIYIETLEINTIFYLLILFNLLTTATFLNLSKGISLFKDITVLLTKKQLLLVWKARQYYGLQDIVTASFVQGGMLLLPLLVQGDIYGTYRGLLLIVAPFALLNLAFSQVLLNQIKNVSVEEKGIVFHSLQKIAIPILVLILGVMYVFREFVLEKIAKLALTETINQAYIGVLGIIFFSFVYSGYEMLLVALNKQKIRFLIMVIGAVVNLITIFTLLPKYGIVGAIGTNLISTFIVFALILWSGEKQLKKY